MASPRLLSVMQTYQFHQRGIRRSVRILSIPLGNRSVVRFDEQLSQKVNKHGDFAGLTAGRASHGADRNSGRLLVSTVADFKSEYLAGLRRNPHRSLPPRSAPSAAAAAIHSPTAPARIPCRG